MESAQTTGAAPARPVAITIVCVILGILLLTSAVVLIGNLANRADPWDPLILAMAIANAMGIAIAVASVGACTVGLWRMRKWAAHTYTVLAVFAQAIMLGGGKWGPEYLVVPAALVIVMLIYLPEMR
jgi:hypothetical protein